MWVVRSADNSEWFTGMLPGLSDHWSQLRAEWFTDLNVRTIARLQVDP
jgi:hypothetical protein